MNEIAGWIAPIATMIAAMMTAANLGARVTGWGFVVFTVGSIAWVTIGLATGQANLLASNAFLTIVNLVGIWRWLGRQARYEDGGAKAAERSADAPLPTLLPLGKIGQAKVRDNAGNAVGDVVEAMIECDTGRINYVVVSMGGVGGLGEVLHALPRETLTFGEDAVTVSLSADELADLPVVERDAWPLAIAA